jgi:fermentation-respiration switch protein FrsA (DUF1100 family)
MSTNGHISASAWGLVRILERLRALTEPNVASARPAWRNEVTLQSVELFTEYEPGAYIEWISPTPFMMVVAVRDHLTVSDEALAAFARALEPKKLGLLTGGHFDAYVKDFESASGNARDWFVQHLGAK